MRRVEIGTNMSLGTQLGHGPREMHLTYRFDD